MNNGDTVGAFAVHEDALNTVGVAVGNSEGGQTFTASITAASIAALVTAGADSPVTIDLNLLPLGQLGSIEGTSTGLTQLGVAITWHVNGTQLDGIIGGDATKVAFTVAKVGTDFVFTLKDNIDNLPSGAGDLDTETLSLAGVFKATDTDGDAVIIDAGASVTIENDVPVNNGDTVGAFAVHEDALNTVGVAVGNSEGGQTFTASITAASIAALVTAGADSPVTIDLNLLPLGQLGSIEGTSTGLTQLGVAITWHVNGTQLDGIIGGDATKVAFTVAKVGTDFVFTLKDNIDNLPSGAGDLDTETLSLAGVFKATDTDGDAVIIDAGASVTIENDIPVNNGDTVGAFAVHEDALNTVGVAVGNSEGGRDVYGVDYGGEHCGAGDGWCGRAGDDRPEPAAAGPVGID